MRGTMVQRLNLQNEAARMTDYQDEIGTVELDVPEIRIIRNIPGDDVHIQQQINEEV